MSAGLKGGGDRGGPLRYPPPGSWRPLELEKKDERDFEGRVHFEGRPQLEALLKLCHRDSWEDTGDLYGLSTYIKFTFIRVLQERKVMAFYAEEAALENPAGDVTPPESEEQWRRDPTTLCFNTGLVSQTLDEVYAVLFRVRLQEKVKAERASSTQAPSFPSFILPFFSLSCSHTHAPPRTPRTFI